jgi:nucleotide-binding universal stress UspA family protein
MIEEIPISEANVFGFRVSGRLTLADYQAFLPMLDKLIQDRGKISLLIELRDFRGWEMKAAREDYSFGMAHQEDFERIAIIGDKAWQRWMTALSAPFVSSEIRYFGQDEKNEAWEWLQATPEEKPSVPAPCPYQHILVATDFSKPARYAALRAMTLSEHYNADISLIHVIEDSAIMMDYQDFVPVNIELDHVLRDNATKQMTQLIEDLGLTDAPTEIGFGIPAIEITEYAEAHDVDLIVIASRGRRGLSRLLGSTARSVQHHANCDVLMVRYTPG